MESEQFDELIRAISDDASRRGVVRAGLGALVVPALAALGLSAAQEAEAKKKKNKKKRRRRKKKSTPPPPPPPPPPPRTSPPPPPPTCAGRQESCEDCTCPAGSICGNNFCDKVPPVCCSDEGGPCGEDDCNCCHRCAGCQDDGLCHCNGKLCDGVCKCECCNDDECPAGQTCDPDGVCVCPGGIVCGSDCCALGAEVCHYEEPDFVECEAGGCPAYEFCTQIDTEYECGVGCPCITSIEGVSSCTDVAEYSCLECTTDAECEADLGPGAFCVPGGEFCTDFCEGAENPEQNFCVSGGCAGLPDAQRGVAAIHGRGAAARGKNVKAAKQNRKKRGHR